VWEKEQDKSPVPSTVHVHQSGVANVKKTRAFIEKETDKLKYLVVGIEAIGSSKTARDLVYDFLNNHTIMTVVDESSRIKNSKAICTKTAIGIGAMSEYRLILTGTPVTQGLEDLYAQFAFLDPAILNTKSYFTFRNLYCVMGGFQSKKILGYQREGELMQKIDKNTFQILKEDCLTLPDKIYTELNAELSKNQLSAMKDLKEFFEVTQGEDTLSISTVLERMVRYQQIIGGNFPFANIDGDGYDTKPIEGGNPKLKVMMENLELQSVDVKVIIWARFRPEISAIAEALTEKYGKQSVVQFHGGISEKDRKISINKFQSNNRVRFFVANQQSAGMGITLTAATLVYYFSNSFSLGDRLQSEDRCHRIGQTKSVTYVDIWAKNPADLMIKRALKNKQNIAEIVTEELTKRNLKKEET